MRRTTPFTIAIALLVALAAGLSACGGEDAQLLPGQTAREIEANLTTVQRLAGEGDCVGAESAVEEVGEQIEELRGVDPKLKQALEKGVARLDEVIARCEEVEDETTPPEVETDEEEGDEGDEESEREGREGRQNQGREDREARQGGGDGGGTGGGEPRPERSEQGEERSGGREGAEGGGGEQPSTGGGEEPEEGQSGGVGPGTAVGGR